MLQIPERTQTLVPPTPLIPTVSGAALKWGGLSGGGAGGGGGGGGGQLNYRRENLCAK